MRHVRGRDAIIGAEHRTKPAAIGAGNVQWEQLLGNLHESNYRGWITLDPLELNDRAAGAETGLKFSAQADGISRTCRPGVSWAGEERAAVRIFRRTVFGTRGARTRPSSPGGPGASA